MMVLAFERAPNRMEDALTIIRMDVLLVRFERPGESTGCKPVDAFECVGPANAILIDDPLPRTHVACVERHAQAVFAMPQRLLDPDARCEVHMHECHTMLYMIRTEQRIEVAGCPDSVRTRGNKRSIIANWWRHHGLAPKSTRNQWLEALRLELRIMQHRIASRRLRYARAPELFERRIREHRMSCHVVDDRAQRRKLNQSAR